jgi:aspartate/methionine/tyrosine aminotransferase
MKFAKRIDQIKPFRVMEVLARAAFYERQGLQVIHFEVGEPDFPTSEIIVAAGREALAQGKTKYTPATGIPELREAISHYYGALGVNVHADQVIVTGGASGGLVLLAGLLLNAGDQLLITDPGYPCNGVFARLTSGESIAVPVTAAGKFQPTVEDIKRVWTPRSRGVLLASPSNPTGTMLPAKDLIEIAEEVSRRDGFFILDEIYQGLTAGADYPTGLAVCEDLYVLNSFSKFFGMTGWRLGWLVVPEAAVDPVTRLAQNLFISPSTPAQYAAVAGFSDEAMRTHRQRAQIFADRAELLRRGLLQLGFSVPVSPQGGFYLYVDVSHTGLAGGEFCRRLLDEFQVAVTPGEDFGDLEKERFVRFAFTTDEAAIEIGLARISQALRAWGNL